MLQSVAANVAIVGGIGATLYALRCNAKPEMDERLQRAKHVVDRASFVEVLSNAGASMPDATFEPLVDAVDEFCKIVGARYDARLLWRLSRLKEYILKQAKGCAPEDASELDRVLEDHICDYMLSMDL